jgi:hypothetical protein|tara:strand:- start:3532 stop:3846 length:315 start_codon:yes stop_codon:yes gene_type:complete
MNLEQKDKTLSGIIMLLTLAMVFYVFSYSGTSFDLEGRTIKDLISFIIEKYLDFAIIGYVFICFQLAGFVELKYKQDFITVSLLSILLTPFSILFILQNENDED